MFPTLQITIGGDRKAGRIIAHSINRFHPSLKSSRDSFHCHLAGLPYEDAFDIGLDLFDRYGWLRHHLYGTFTDETDEGRLLLIEKVTLNSHNHQGIECKAVKILLQRLNDVSAFSTWFTFAGKLSCPCHALTPRHSHSCKSCPTTQLHVACSLIVCHANSTSTALGLFMQSCSWTVVRRAGEQQASEPLSKQAT